MVPWATTSPKNGISIGSSVLALLVHARDQQNDRPCYNGNIAIAMQPNEKREISYCRGTVRDILCCLKSDALLYEIVFLTHGVVISSKTYTAPWAVALETCVSPISCGTQHVKTSGDLLGLQGCMTSFVRLLRQAAIGDSV